MKLRFEKLNTKKSTFKKITAGLSSKFDHTETWLLEVAIAVAIIILFIGLFLGGFVSWKIKPYFSSDTTSSLRLISMNKNLESKLSKVQKASDELAIELEKQKKTEEISIAKLNGAINNRDTEIAIQAKQAADARAALVVAEAEFERARKALEENLTISTEASAEVDKVVAQNPLVEPKTQPAITATKSASVSTSIPEMSDEDKQDEIVKQGREILDSSEKWVPQGQFEISDAQALIDRLDKFVVWEGWTFPLITNNNGLPSVIKGGSAPEFLAEKGLKWELRAVTLENPLGKGHFATTGWAVKGKLKEKSTVKVNIPKVPPMKLVE